jgi:hypothetical protein
VDSCHMLALKFIFIILTYLTPENVKYIER